MSEQQLSRQIHQVYLEALSRFDHFVMGATLAVCAYLAQSNPYEKIGLNVPTLYLISLLLVAGAAFCGFKRLEHVVQTLRLNAQLLESREQNNSANKIEQMKFYTERASQRTHNYYIARNICLLLGFIVYLTAKIATPYSTPWI